MMLLGHDPSPGIAYKLFKKHREEKVEAAWEALHYQELRKKEGAVLTLFAIASVLQLAAGSRQHSCLCFYGAAVCV